MKEDNIREALHRVTATKTALRHLEVKLGVDLLLPSETTNVPEVSLSKESSALLEGLGTVSPILADSYLQVKRDIQDETRVSWAGTAHEIRQIVATLLANLAPDELVMAEPNYIPERKDSKSPTQKQRVKYILKTHNADSVASDLAGRVAELDEMISNVIRDLYSRASDAAHRFKSRKEATRLLRYFEAFVIDLLNLD